MLNAIYNEREHHLLAPQPALFTPHIKKGVVLTSGSVIGHLEILGQEILIQVANLPSLMVAKEVHLRGAVAYGSLLVKLAHIVGSAVDTSTTSAQATRKGQMQLHAPFSGRFYSRPSPEAAAFINKGDKLKHGQVVCMLEVMKTFSRIQYPTSLPDGAELVSILVSDGDDVEQHQALFDLK